MVQAFEEQHKGPQAVKDFVTSLSDDADQTHAFPEELEECEEEVEEEIEENFEVDETITPADLSPATRAPTKRFVNSPKAPCMAKSPPMATPSMAKAPPTAQPSTCMAMDITKGKINTSTCKPAWMKLIRLMESNKSCSMEVKKLFNGGPKET